MPGGCWFFTANLLDRRSGLLTAEIDTLREATRLFSATMWVCAAMPSGIAPRLMTIELAKAARPSGVHPEFWMYPSETIVASSASTDLT